MLTEYYIRYMFDPNAVSMIFFILFFKSTDDILQGISKLDYLLKVSIFQFYKDERLREAQKKTYSISSVGSDVGMKKSRFETRFSRELNKERNASI